MNFYPFHIGDYAVHTAHLDEIEDLAYRRALDRYYLDEHPLPRDPAEVARLLRLRAYPREVETILREYFDETPEGWRHARCDEVIAAYAEKSQKAKASASASVASRRAKAAERTLNERSTGAQRVASDVGAKNGDEPADPTPAAPSEPSEPSEPPKNGGSDSPEAKNEGGSPANAERPLNVRSTGVELTINQEPITKEKGESSLSRGSSLPADWTLPTEWAEWARLERPDLDPARTAERFADYWRAVPGAKGRKSDWLATWRNWVRAEKPGSLRPVATAESFAERDERLRREKWEAMTGRRWPGSSDPLDPVTMTANPTTLELLQ